MQYKNVVTTKCPYIVFKSFRAELMIPYGNPHKVTLYQSIKLYENSQLYIWQNLSNSCSSGYLVIT